MVDSKGSDAEFLKLANSLELPEFKNSDPALDSVVEKCSESELSKCSMLGNL